MVGKRKRVGGFSSGKPVKKASAEDDVGSDSSDDVPLNVYIQRKNKAAEVESDSSEDLALNLLRDRLLDVKAAEPSTEPQPGCSTSTDGRKEQAGVEVDTDSSDDLPLQRYVNRPVLEQPIANTEPRPGCSSFPDPMETDVPTGNAMPNEAVMEELNDLVQVVAIGDEGVEEVNDHEPEIPNDQAVPIVDDNVIEDFDDIEVIRHRRTHGSAFIREGVIFERIVRKNAVGGMHTLCVFCGAKLFGGEVNEQDGGGRLCCMNGLVDMPLNEPCHPQIQNLLTVKDNEFRQHIRGYNAALSFASFEANIQNFDIGTYVFRINGTPYHKVGPLHPANENQRRNAQMYIVDNATATGLRAEAFPECNREILRDLDATLREVNPFCQAYKMIHEVETDERLVAEAENRPVRRVVMVLKNPGDRPPNRRYDAPAANEVAVVFRGSVPENLPNIQIYTRDHQLVTLNVLSPQTDPLCYPLIFQRGELGFRLNIPHTRGRGNVSIREFYAFFMSIRNQFNVAMFSGRLTHQLIVDSWTRTECCRINFIKSNQSKLRAEVYNCVVDQLNRIADHEEARVGRMVILPSSFANSPRSNYENYVDAISIFKKNGPPSYFITFTCNPNWAEVKAALNPFETPNDRPDILNRVFHLKLGHLVDDLYKNEILGRATSLIYSVEFQKRGLPHAHIVLGVCAADDVHCSDDIDQRVCAELPDDVTQPQLFEKVVKHQIHGPCGMANRKSPCMVDGVCSKKYPKLFRPNSVYHPGGYPVYRRRDDGRTAIVRGSRTAVDNRSVVPYNPYLTIKYDAHINVEICSGQKWVKYLFKYCFKGYDCLSVAFDILNEERVVNYDECKAYLDSRYVSAPEAHWRLVAFPIRHMSHSVEKLPVHLPGQNLIVFHEANVQRAMDNPNIAETKLTAFFKLNEGDVNARQYLYKEIPLQFTFHQQSRTWQARQRNPKVVSRVCEANPKDKERYCLRLLLENVPGPKSFDDLKTVDGVLYETFQGAAQARHLMINDRDSVNCLEEASHYRMPAALRRLFVTLCLHNQVDATNLWEQFLPALVDDYRRRRLPEPEAINRALCHIDYLLRMHGSSCEQQGLPIPVPVGEGFLEDLDGEEQHERPVFDVNTLNHEQRFCYQTIMEAVDDYQNGDRMAVKAFFIDGVGGSGKSYLYETILESIRGRQLISIAVAVSGIAATLLTGGQTAHSAFRLPLKIDENTTCGISIQSPEAQRIRDCAIILWDEASMVSCNMLHAVDRLLKDIMHSLTAFGGKVIVFGGDFRQILPIVSHGNRQHQLEACLKMSHLWHMFKQFSLQANMRAAEERGEFARWIKDIGEGNPVPVEYPDASNRTHRLPNDTVGIPEECVQPEHLDDWVFDELENPDHLTTRAVLCPRNCDVDQINERILQKMPGEKVTFFSTNVQPEGDLDQPLLPQEYMQTLNIGGLPPHTLNLKPNATVMLIRNVDVRRGLCNGTRMRVDHVGANVIKCSVMTGPNQGQVALLGRLNLQPIESGVTFTRTQFPVRLSFAMTINKAQGQTLDRVGIFLPTPVFSHGQLYVALSRAKRFQDIRVQIMPTRKQGYHRPAQKWLTRNIVYKEVLEM